MIWQTIAQRALNVKGVTPPIFLCNDNGANRHRFFVDVTSGEAVLEVSYDDAVLHLNTPESAYWHVLELGRFDSDMATEVVGTTAVRLRGFSVPDKPVQMQLEAQSFQN